jgi:hypothetical protein
LVTRRIASCVAFLISVSKIRIFMIVSLLLITVRTFPIAFFAAGLAARGHQAAVIPSAAFFAGPAVALVPRLAAIGAEGIVVLVRVIV